MYNSFIVRIFVGAGNAFTLAYKGSVLKRIVDTFKRCISYLTKGSVFINIFTKNYSFIEKSIFYRLFSKVLDFATNIFKSLNKLFKTSGQGSIVYKSLSKLFGDSRDLIRSIMVFILFFAIGIIVNNLIRGAFSGRSYLVSLILVLGSLVVISLGENLDKLLNNSFIYRFLKDLFIIDEGGEQWW